MNILLIEQLTIATIIGVYDWEKQCLQNLVFDLEVAYDMSCFKDNSNTLSYLDYTKISHTIIDLLNNKQPFSLIEEVAEMTAAVLMEKFCISWIRLKVNKPNALYNARNVGVCIERYQKR